MSPQLRAAFTRALLQAVVAGVLAYFGGETVADSVVDEVAASSEPTTTTAPDRTTTTTTTGAPDRTDEEDVDTSGAQLTLALAAGVAFLVARGLVEGLYDTRRQEKGDVKDGDVSSDSSSDASSKDVGAVWVRASDRGDDRLLVVAARMDSSGKTHYLLAEGDDTPIWRSEDQLSSFKVGAQS